MRDTLLDGWTLGSLVRWGLFTVVLYFVLNVFFEANVRNLLEERGWDKFLSHMWRAAGGAVGKMHLLRDRYSF